jgi:hypothetical protein
VLAIAAARDNDRSQAHRYLTAVTKDVLYLPPVNDATLDVRLEAVEASTTAEILLRLAALIDPDDPEALQDTFGRRHEGWERGMRLTDAQFGALRRPVSYSSNERTEVAGYLRIISARIEGQLPGDAPAIWHGPRTPQ